MNEDFRGELDADLRELIAEAPVDVRWRGKSFTGTRGNLGSEASLDPDGGGVLESSDAQVTLAALDFGGDLPQAEEAIYVDGQPYSISKATLDDLNSALILTLAEPQQ